MTLTHDLYENIDKAFNFFNEKLFDGTLPPMIFTLHRKKNARGYFWSSVFRGETNSVAHEIALNPDTFKGRTDLEILSTFVHEMVHLQQEVSGKPSKNGYHNKEWAKMMETVGLIPSTTGKPDGKKTGNRVSHYIDESGNFYFHASNFLNSISGRVFNYYGVPQIKISASNNSRVRYECEDCGKAAYAKPDTGLMCTECLKTMVEN